MGSAEIGALRVRLSAEQAEYSEGLKDAEKRLDAFGRKFNSAAGSISRAASSIGGALAGLFTVQAVRNALLHADAMGKMAQAAGLTTEEFSALAHAASLADLSAEELSASLAKFNRSIADASKGSGEAAQAFAAMDVALRENGQLRATGDILADVATRFQGYAGDANKAALAMEVFGKSGAKMIPLLNAGRDGLAAAKDEASAFGVVVSDEAAKKAEAFNDNLTRLGAVTNAWARDIGNAVAGPLTRLIQLFLDAHKEARSFQEQLRKEQDAQIAARATAALASAVGETTAEYERLRAKEAELLQVPVEQMTSRQRKELAMLRPQIAGVREALAGLQAQQATATPAAAAPGALAPNLEEQARKAAQAYADAVQPFLNAVELDQERVATYGQVLQGVLTPMEEYRQKMLDIAQASQISLADTDKLAQASVQAWARMQSGIASSAANLTGALAQLFQKNKGFAYANALMNTYEAFTRALANPPGPPFSYVNAAAALVSGMAQVRAIQSTNPGTGGGGGGAAAAPAAAPAASSPSTAITLQATDPAGLFSWKVIQGLAEQLNAYTRNGGVLISTRNLPV